MGAVTLLHPNHMKRNTMKIAQATTETNARIPAASQLSRIRKATASPYRITRNRNDQATIAKLPLACEVRYVRPARAAPRTVSPPA